MNEKKFIKGQEFLYLPDASDFKSLQKVYFLFVRIIKSDRSVSKQYIFAKKSDDINRYQSVTDYENDMESSNFIGFDEFVINDDLSFFRKYSEKKETDALNMYNFFVNNEKLYIRLLKYTKLFSNDNESFFWSKDFSRFRKNMFLYKLRFYLKLFLFVILGTLKFILYIPIFLIDIFKNSILSYRVFKKKESKAKFYRNNTLMNRALLNVSEEDFEKRKIQENKELNDLKEKYINSNISIFTLLIAIGTLIFTVVENVKVMKQNQKQIVETSEKISLIQEENLLLKNEINLEKSKNELLKELIDSNMFIDDDIDDKYAILQSKIDSLQNDFNSYKKKNSNSNK